jgi:ABC-type lipoprotein export system ATPase subunit
MSSTPPSLSLPQPPVRAPEFGRDALIVCESLVRIYQTGSVEVQALQGLDLAVDSGEMVAVVGASGSGKSTLLSILAGIDAPTAGRARVDRWNLLSMSRADRVHYRRHTVGFVRQQTASNLVPYLTARQMVDLPMTTARTPVKARRDRAAELLATLGVADCADRRPAQLSGGQQMRVAIAVALANQPRVLLADEPTGELDSKTGDEIYRILRELQARRQTTLVVVTHDRRFITPDDLVLEIEDGRLLSDGQFETSERLAGVR